MTRVIASCQFATKRAPKRRKRGETRGRWGGRWGSNPRQQESQSWTLPTELRPPLNYDLSGTTSIPLPGQLAIIQISRRAGKFVAWRQDSGATLFAALGLDRCHRRLQFQQVGK